MGQEKRKFEEYLSCHNLGCKSLNSTLIRNTQEDGDGSHIGCLFRKKEWDIKTAGVEEKASSRDLTELERKRHRL